VSRVMILSKDGYVCLAPSGVRVDDIIVVLLGASVPFILRRIIGNLEHEEYELIGEAYVHGIMDGEILEEWRAGRRQPQ
ncbi:hypothetical protein AOQ84DRAFT_261660, partial [Glonium stellatum]